MISNDGGLVLSGIYENVDILRNDWFCIVKLNHRIITAWVLLNINKDVIVLLQNFKKFKIEKAWKIKDVFHLCYIK